MCWQMLWLGLCNDWGVPVCASLASDDESEKMKEVFLEAIEVSAKTYGCLVQITVVKYILVCILKQGDVWQQGASTCLEGAFLHHRNFVCDAQVSPEQMPSTSLMCVFTR